MWTINLTGTFVWNEVAVPVDGKCPECGAHCTAHITVSEWDEVKDMANPEIYFLCGRCADPVMHLQA